MGFSLKQNEPEARERLRAFWGGSSLGRPALHVTVKNPAFVEKPFPKAAIDRKQRDFMPEWHQWYNHRRLNSVLYLAEAMPAAEIVWGANISLVAIQSGTDYEYDEAGHAWVKPCPQLWDGPLPVFNRDHEVIRKLEQCYCKVMETVGNQGYINPPVMLDSLTTLSLIRSADMLCVDLMEEPEKVKAFSEAMTRLYLDAYDHFYRLLESHGYRETSSWLSAMSEGKFEAIQCDFGVMLSPSMFEEFALPDLRRLTEYFDNTLYHLDGTCQLRFLSLLRKLPRLSGIQWNPEPAAGSPVKWIEAFKEIRNQGFCLHIWCEPDEAVQITRALGPDGLMLVLPTFDTVEDAVKAIGEMEKA